MLNTAGITSAGISPLCKTVQHPRVYRG